MTHKIETQLDLIQAYIAQQKLSLKEILNISEAAEYTGLSKSYLYKKISLRSIPFYKLGGKLVYFKRSDLEAYLLSNRKAPLSELADAKPTLVAGKLNRNSTGTRS